MKLLIYTLTSFLVATIAGLQIFNVIGTNQDADGRQTTAIVVSASMTERFDDTDTLVAAGDDALEQNSFFGGFALESSTLAYALFGMAVLTITILGRRAGESSDVQV